MSVVFASNGTGCGVGYTGPLCSLCAPGYFLNFGKCDGAWAAQSSFRHAENCPDHDRLSCRVRLFFPPAPACPTGSNDLVFAVAGFVAVVLVVGAVMFKFRALLPVPTIKLCVSYAQGALV